MQAKEQRETAERTRFFFSNMLKGLVWLAAILGGYFYLKNNYDFSLEEILGPIYDKPLVIFSIFMASETIFGIIPPEFFMLWSLRDEVLADYVLNVALLSGLSYLAGIIGYYIGSHFSTTRLYRSLQKNYLGKYEKHVNRFGGFLVIVAAMTPIPFAGICMLMGTVKYSFRMFLIMSLSRILRFAIYAVIIWEANVLQ